MTNCFLGGKNSINNSMSFFAIKVCLDSKFNQQFNVYSLLLKFARIPFQRMLAPKTFVESVNNYVFAMKTQLGHDRE